VRERCQVSGFRCQGGADADRKLVLASGSARRRKILAELGVEFAVEVPDVEEVCLAADPRATVCENARRKADWATGCWPDAAVVAADTVIDFRGRAVNKPGSLDDARAMFRAFSGAAHDVLTGVALRAPGGRPEIHLATSTVHFRDLTDGDIEAYFARVDPLDKAGAYDIDREPELIIASFSGSRTNIMGLPRGIVRAWLEKREIGAAG